jgi:SRSO17 transposase
VGDLVLKSFDMSFEMTSEVHARLDGFFDKQIGQHLTRRQRETFAIYARGLIGEGERKSVEPIASRATGEPEACKHMHDRLLYFVGRSSWSDRLVRREAAWYAIRGLEACKDPVVAWILDDTGFLKQGTHSVGVQRQYTGSAGKVTNCQIGVSLCIATRSEHVPIDFELYLPKCWIEDPARRCEARIPEDVVFKTKPELAMELITRAVEDKIPGEIVLVDSAYGDSCDLRNVIRMYGLDIGVAIKAPTKVWLLDSAERWPGGPPVSVQELGIQLGPRAFRRLTWREGTRGGVRGKLHSRFCFRRVKVAHDDGTEAEDREALWLMTEWPEGEPKPTKFVLTSLPRKMSKKHIVRLIKERWRTERAYEDLKGELGLDHFEGRSFPGWHHHISVALCCYAFIVIERLRHFPPSEGWAGQVGANLRAA